MTKLSDNPDEFKDQTENCNAEIQSILTTQCEGAKIRAKACHLEASDKPTSYFLGIEKRRVDFKTLDSLSIQGQLTSHFQEIIAETRSFYSDLLKSRLVDKSTWPQLTASLPVLTPDDRIICEGPLTPNECFTAIKTMSDNKSPGGDGLPAEFYKLFFPLFAQAFVTMVNSNPQF